MYPERAAALLENRMVNKYFNDLTRRSVFLLVKVSTSLNEIVILMKQYAFSVVAEI